MGSREVKSEFFAAGDRIQLQDEKGRLISFNLKTDEVFHTHKGFIHHNEVIGLPEGSIVETNSGLRFQAFRPLYSDYVLGMPRGATIIYPKDSALILGYGDFFSGLKVLEAGLGSGALAIAILKSIGESGELHSFELREEFANIAKKNIEQYFGAVAKNHYIHLGDVELASTNAPGPYDRIVLDMLAPWEHVELVAQLLKPGGVFIIYVATTTQLSRIAETIKESGKFTEPESFETLLRNWHHEGLAVRPSHSMNGHTGFLTITRRISGDGPGLIRRRRPAKASREES